ncbi:MAG TPA: rhomboid family intramembrane serine protease, partial [Planctomycetaceae bacterium]|nr:rhomboid family intramembrane serine protease [Planctomycetaceae bacterium]
MTIALDVFGAIGVGDSNVAYTAHLGGAAWGALHFRWGSRWLDRFDPTSLRKAFRRKPKLQVVRDEYGDEVERDKYELDRILAKLHDQGQSSLTGA